MPPPKRHSDPVRRAEAVLAAPHTTAAELLDLIHAVNPTSRALPKSDQSVRYSVKSALQSLLVTLHGDDLRIEPTRDPNIVGLRHRYLAADACHAALDELSDDARSVVQRRIDMGELDLDAPPPAAPSRPRRRAEPSPAVPAAPPTDPLSAGRAALAAYDYDEARRSFEAALADQPDDIDAAQALLELLVDTLAQDADALSLAADLPRRTQGDPAVRVLCARASARTGDLAAAERWLAGVDPEPPDVLVLCARAALASGDAAEARSLAARARRAGAPVSDVEAVERELRSRDDRELALAEQSLSELTDAAAVSLAERIRARWPKSAAASAVLAGRAAALAEERAKAALAGDNVHELRAALTPDLSEPTRREIESRLTALIALARDRERAARIDEARALFGLQDRKAAYGAFLRLPADERTAVVLDPSTVVWLERIGQRFTKRLDVLVELIDAIVQAERHPEDALRVLSPYADRIADTPAADLLSRARQAQAELRRAEMAAEQDRAAALAQRAKLDRIDALVRAGRWLDALSAIEDDHPDADRLRAELRANARRAFGVQTGADPSMFWTSWVDATPAAGIALEWLRPGTDLVVFAFQLAERIFLVEYDVRAKRAVRHARFVLPRSGELEMARVDGATMTLLGTDGSLFEVSLDDFAPLRYRPAVAVAEDTALDHIVLPRGQRYLWVSRRRLRGERETGVGVIDTETGTTVREIDGHPVEVQGLAAVLVATVRSTTLSEPRGKPVAGTTLPGWISSAAVHPSGEGLVVLLPSEDGEGATLAEARGGAVVMHPLEHGFIDAHHWLATARDAASTLVWFQTEEDAVLERWTLGGDKLERAWSVACPDCAVVTDADASRALVLFRTEGGIALVDPSGPDFCPPPAFDLVETPHTTGLCGFQRWPDAGEPAPSEAEIARARALFDRPEKWALDPDAVDEALSVLRRTHAIDVVVDWERALPRHAPDHPRVKLLAIDRHLDARPAGELAAAVRAVDADELSAAERQHYHHAHAVSAMRARDFTAAARHVVESKKWQGRCDRIDVIAALACPLGQAVSLGETTDSTDVLSAVRYRTALSLADEALARGDHDGVRRALCSVRLARDPQSLARLAEVELAPDRRADADRLRREWTLASYLAALAGDRSIFESPETWDTARLAALADRARASLAAETSLATPRTPPRPSPP